MAGDELWRSLADQQESMLSHRQLRELGVTPATIRHHLSIGRWARRSHEVVSTTTGPLAPEQRLWLGVLHAGPSSMIGGLNAAGVHGLERWARADVTVLVANPLSWRWTARSTTTRGRPRSIGGATGG